MPAQLGRAPDCRMQRACMHGHGTPRKIPGGCLYRIVSNRIRIPINILEYAGSSLPCVACHTAFGALVYCILRLRPRRIADICSRLPIARAEPTHLSTSSIIFKITINIVARRSLRLRLCPKTRWGKHACKYASIYTSMILRPRDLPTSPDCSNSFRRVLTILPDTWFYRACYATTSRLPHGTDY